MYSGDYKLNGSKKYALMAQLDSATGFYPVGCRFEPYWECAVSTIGATFEN